MYGYVCRTVFPNLDPYGSGRDTSFTLQYPPHCSHSPGRAYNLIQGIGSASRSSIELFLGRIPQPGSPLTIGAMRLGDTSDVGNPESHTFGLSVVGDAGSLLPRRAGVRTRTLEGDLGRSSASVSSLSSVVAAATVALATVTCVRGQLEGRRCCC